MRGNRVFSEVSLACCLADLSRGDTASTRKDPDMVDRAETRLKLGDDSSDSLGV